MPDGVSYTTGDHLLVWAEQPTALVERFAARFGLCPDDVVTLTGAVAAAPTDVPLSVRALLGRYVELGQPASAEDARWLAERCPCPPDRARLTAWADAADAELRDKRRSLLDLLSAAPSATADVAEVLARLPASRPRRYSISSSPVVDPGRLTLTVAGVRGPAWSGAGTYEGAASSFLARARPGDNVYAKVIAPEGPFRLPDPGVPVILISAGTGFAPFRGFLEERAAVRASGAAVAPAEVFFGCDHPDVDLLYKDELHTWIESGIARLYPAFFRAPDGDVQFVQHRLLREATVVRAAVDAGAVVYVCGDGRHMAPGVRAAVDAVIGADGRQALVEAGRWREDIFAS